MLGFTIVFESPAGCEIEQAQLTFVPPNTTRVLMTEQCGGFLTCWTRWLDVDGKQVMRSRACETEHSRGGSDISINGGN